MQIYTYKLIKVHIVSFFFILHRRHLRTTKTNKYNNNRKKREEEINFPNEIVEIVCV